MLEARGCLTFRPEPLSPSFCSRLVLILLNYILRLFFLQVCEAIDGYLETHGRKVRITYELDELEVGQEAAEQSGSLEIGQGSDLASFDSAYEELIPRRRGPFERVWNTLRRGL